MEKQFFFVVSLGLVVGVLATHWLSLAENTAGLNSAKSASIVQDQKAKSAPSATLKKVPSLNSTASTEESPETKPKDVSNANVEKLLKDYTANLYAMNQDYSARDKALKENLKRLTTAELRPLGSVVLNHSAGQDERSSALYLLGLAGPAAIPLLSEVAGATVPKAANSAFEISLRAGALEYLDHWAVQGVDVRDALTFVLKTQSHPTLNMFAQVSLTGLLEGRPGKLHRLSEKTFGEL